MQLPLDAVLDRRLRKWSHLLTITLMAAGVVVLVGWQLANTPLKTLFLPPVPMNPLTAISFIFCGYAIWRSPKNISGTLRLLPALIVLFIALVRLADVFFGFGLSADTLLYEEQLKADANGLPAVRMAPVTAVCFLLAALSIFLIPFETKYRHKFSHYAVLIIALFSLHSILAYFYKARNIDNFSVHISMAVPAAICFLIFSLVVLFAEPGKGLMEEFSTRLSGSTVARYLIPAAIIVPSGLGLLRLYGNWAGIYTDEFGTTLFVLSTIVILTGITWYNAWLLNRRDIQRVHAEGALYESEQQIHAIFHHAPDAVILTDKNGIVKKWNPEAEKIFGWKEAEVVGQSLIEILTPGSGGETNRPRIKEHFAESATAVAGQTVDLLAVTKRQEKLDISLKASPVTVGQDSFFICFLRDIAHRKLIENKLKSFNEELSRQVQEKTSELTDIFERITDGFIALDQNYRYTYINKKAGQLTRRDPASLIGKNVWEEFPTSVGSQTYEAFHTAMEEQRFVSNTDYYAPLDLWQSNFIYPSANGLSVFIRDITGQKKAESEITRARDLADKLIDSLPGVFYFFDAHGKFIRWNKEFEKATRYSSAEIEHMHPSDFFPEEERHYILKRIEGVFETGVNDAEAHFKTKTGELVPYYFKAVRINFNGQPCLLGNGIDITQRKKAENKLLASEHKYKLLFRSNPLPMWMLNLPAYNINDVNEAALLQYGYTKEEFLNISPAQLRPPEERERFYTTTNTNFRGIFHAGVWRHQRKDGSLIYVDVITYDINHEGQQTRLVLANNVTERHIAEEKLKESFDAIRKLTEHLQNVREQERLHIAREIHDELGQLLTVMKMDVSWVKRKTETDDQEVKNKLSSILEVIDMTAKTVRRIASELRPSLLDDLGLQAAMEWHLEEFEKRSGIQKELHLPASEILLPDALKIGIFRIFQESLTNVARHADASRVIVRLEHHDNKLLLTIQDNGKGFTEKEANKNTLGLLGMKERTQMMGGEYSISGIPEGGTIVTVMIPLPGVNL
jgi:PAS domain S-box-containing protein